MPNLYYGPGKTAFPLWSREVQFVSRCLEYMCTTGVCEEKGSRPIQTRPKMHIWTGDLPVDQGFHHLAY